MKLSPSRRILSLFLLATLAGCQAPTSDSVAHTATPSSIIASPSSGEISEESLNSLAENLVKALSENDTAALSELVDESTFVDRVTRAISDSKIKATATAQARAVASQPMGPFAFASFPVWRSIKVWTVQEEGRILLIGYSDRDTAYVECRVEKRGARLQIVDIALFLRERTLSQDLATLVAALSAQKDDTKNRYLAYQKAITAGEYPDALKMFRTFPPAVQKQPLAAFSQISMAAWINRELHTRSLNDFIRSLPPGTPLNELHVRALYCSGKYEEQIAAIRGIRKRLDLEDTALDLEEATSLAQIGRFEEGRALLLATLEREPDSEDPKWGLVNIALVKRDYEEAARLLDQFLPIYPDLPQSVRQREDCQAFIASPVGKAWLEKAEESAATPAVIGSPKRAPKS